MSKIFSLLTILFLSGCNTTNIYTDRGRPTKVNDTTTLAPTPDICKDPLFQSIASCGSASRGQTTVAQPRAARTNLKSEPVRISPPWSSASTAENISRITECVQRGGFTRAFCARRIRDEITEQGAYHLLGRDKVSLIFRVPGGSVQIVDPADGRLRRTDEVIFTRALNRPYDITLELSITLSTGERYRAYYRDTIYAANRAIGVQKIFYRECVRSRSGSSRRGECTY